MPTGSSSSPMVTRKGSSQLDLFKELKELIKESKTEVINTVRADLHNLEAKVESLSARFTDLESSVTNIRREQTWLKSEVASVKTEMSSLVQDFSNVSMTEIENRMTRLNNIIVRGLSEPDGTVEERMSEDIRAVKELLTALNFEAVDVCNVRRLGKPVSNNMRPRLLRVTLPDINKKQELLRKSKLLMQTRFKDVFIQGDLTPMQQRHERDIRRELRERRQMGEDAIISRGAVRLRSDVQVFRR